MRRAAVVVGCAAAIAACAAAATTLTTDWDGAYEHRFENRLVSGERFESTNSLDIFRIDDQSALVDIALEFYNGHECAFTGVFQVEGESLVYREPESALPDDRGQCVLTIVRENGQMVLGDENGDCRDTCGARGGYDDVALPVASQRPRTNEEHARTTRQLELLQQAEP
jgi:hypothetical protein